MRRSETVELGISALQLLAIGAIAIAVEGFFETNRLGGLVLSGAAVLLLGRRVGLKTSPGETATGTMLRRTARGFAVGTGWAAAVVVLAWAFGWAEVTWGTWDGVGVALGLVAALAQSGRDELLFRGLPLAVVRGRVSDWYALPFVAVLGATPWMLAPGRTVMGIVLVVVLGLGFAVLWRSREGLYDAWGAHGGCLFVAGTATRGSIIDSAYTRGDMVRLPQAEGPVGGLAVVAAIAMVAAILFAWRRRSARVDSRDG